MTAHELLRRYPQAADLDHESLGELPTPVEPLGALGAEVGIDDLWVKRDDLTSPIYGGNKVRKLEYLLAHAKATGHDQVWTIGAIGSHHVLATSIFSRQLGLEPHALHFPQPVTDHVLQVLRALSTTEPKLELIGSKNALPFEFVKQHLKRWLSRGDNPYYIPGGGSSPRGVLGYVNAAFELARQVDDGEIPAPDIIVVAAGTCGTLAGLILGAKLAELPSQIVGVRVVDKVLANSVTTANLANRAAKLLADAGIVVPKIRASDIEIIDDQIGAGYGEPTPAGLEAMEQTTSHAPFRLDPTYTAKAFAGLLARQKASTAPPQTVLYWHTLSSADLSDRIANADIDASLPAKYRAFFDDPR